MASHLKGRTRCDALLSPRDTAHREPGRLPDRQARRRSGDLLFDLRPGARGGTGFLNAELQEPQAPELLHV
eukprot:CAMPEP_0174303748 /NCGR_PEP_ID=MMETSP0809-20121228/60370_1 /TAXON_ID=73025 ORGANISM="Eutreptiella gymnastica-like, Strain CCMP1594" /NCGR_SAMPLE_ID=MMETSP0809 /ASSEMBLY_ACC=CAM_ASM_000658 /LENGTH=70 /DNA_ID=CAMNT_0015409831 /DNA_START=1347 /DNA_END=1559 /DNA_ORIENTATION=+